MFYSASDEECLGAACILDSGLWSQNQWIMDTERRNWQNRQIWWQASGGLSFSLLLYFLDFILQILNESLANSCDRTLIWLDVNTWEATMKWRFSPSTLLPCYTNVACWSTRGLWSRSIQRVGPSASPLWNPPTPSLPGHLSSCSTREKERQTLIYSLDLLYLMK